MSHVPRVAEHPVGVLHYRLAATGAVVLQFHDAVVKAVPHRLAVRAVAEHQDALFPEVRDRLPHAVFGVERIPAARDGGELPRCGAERAQRRVLEALGLSDLPPVALRVQLLMYSGMSPAEAFEKLGVDRTSRYRVRDQLSQFRDKTAGQ